MFGLFVQKSEYNVLKKDFDAMRTKCIEVMEENSKLKQKIENVTEDNQELRTINDFYIDKYKNAKNIIRVLNNDKSDYLQIPENCPKCNTLLVYNEYSHIATCPSPTCDVIFK